MRRKDAKSGLQMPRNARADAGTPAPLSCAEVRAREWDFVEGVLPNTMRASVEAHLDGCESCRRAVTLCRSAENALLSASAYIPAAGDLRTGFYARLATQPRPARRHGLPLALSGLAAGLLALAVIRPTFPPRAVSPPHPGSTIAATTLGLRPAIVPTATLRVASSMPRHLRDLQLLPEGLTNTLLSSAASRAVASNGNVASKRYRRTLRRAVSHSLLHTMVASVAPQTWAFRSLITPTSDANRMYYVDLTVDRSQADAILVLKKTVKLPTLQADLDAKRRDAKVRESLPSFGLIAAASLPADVGVSLEVTDQVRGFSNTTHVASEVEVQGETSTIHVTADGN